MIALSTPHSYLCSWSPTASTAATVNRNNGGGHYNHSFFWKVMTNPSNTNGPSSALKEAIDSSFGSLDELKTRFNAAAAGRFGKNAFTTFPKSYWISCMQITCLSYPQLTFLTVFSGSGWAWLTVNDGKLAISSTPNQVMPSLSVYVYLNALGAGLTKT